MEKNEEKVVNDAIQYWRGFSDALSWIRKEQNIDRLDEQLDKSNEMIEIYRDRLQIVRKRKKNERRNGRD